jgi:hypothetical protein
MKLSAVLLSAFALTASAWKIEVGREAKRIFEGERSQRCTEVGGEHRWAEFHPRAENIDRHGDVRFERCCVRFFADRLCDDRRGGFSETCDRGYKEFPRFEAFTVDCRRE